MKIFDYLMAIPKSLYFNIVYFGIRGAMLPILISHRTCLKKLRGTILLPDKTSIACIRIGFGDVPIFDRKRSRTIFYNHGIISFKGKAKIGHGAKIVVKKNGHLTLGNRFNMSAESTIYCSHEIIFGDYNLLSWDVQIIDSDFHEVYQNGKPKVAINPDAPIITGDSVWFCSRSTVLKGVNIPSNCIISANTNVTRSLQESFCIYGGNPAKVIKSNITWDSAARDY